MYLLSSHSSKIVLPSTLESAQAPKKSVIPQVFDLPIKIFFFRLKREDWLTKFLLFIFIDRDEGIFVYHNSISRSIIMLHYVNIHHLLYINSSNFKIH